MSSIQLIKYAKKQENVTHNQEKKIVKRNRSKDDKDVGFKIKRII